MVPVAMAGLARVVLPGIPHHVTARGNRREPLFFEDGDYQLFRDLLADTARHYRGSRNCCDGARQPKRPLSRASDCAIVRPLPSIGAFSAVSKIR